MESVGEEGVLAEAAMASNNSKGVPHTGPGHSIVSLVDIAAVIGTIVVLCFCDAWTREARARLAGSYRRSPLGLCVDAAILSVSLVMSACFPLAAPGMAIMLLGVSAYVRHRSKSIRRNPPCERSQNPHAKPPWLVVFRAAMLLATCVVILAVDLPVFPKSSAKSVTYGFTLMDLGVGAMALAAGFGFNTRFRWHPRTMLQSTGVLALLGALRVVAVKATSYHEEVVEYGMHWNFFFTLAALHLLRPVFRLAERLSFVLWIAALAALAALSHHLLYAHAWEHYIFHAPRSNLFSQNREGIFGLLGFSLLFETAYRAGEMCLTCPSAASLWLTRWTLGAGIAAVITMQSGILPSRRLVNLPYIALTLAVSFGTLLALSSISNHFAAYRPSPVAAAINRRGLEVFLLANVLTGVCNLTLPTATLGAPASLLLLLAYTLGIVAAADAMVRHDLRLRFLFQPGQRQRCRQERRRSRELSLHRSRLLGRASPRAVRSLARRLDLTPEPPSPSYSHPSSRTHTPPPTIFNMPLSPRK